MCLKMPHLKLLGSLFGQNLDIFDYKLEKVNFPENALFYINQAYLNVQKSKKVFYAEYFLLGQIHESSNQSSNIKNMSVLMTRLNTIILSMIEIENF